MKVLKYDILLLLTASIWGFAFVAQRVGMEHIGPFVFNGIRFTLGALVLIPFLFNKDQNTKNFKTTLIGGIYAGIALFLGSSLQQVGIVYTTAGNAGFITGLYVVIVPIFGIFLGHKTGKANWVGVFLAVIGLYLLSVNEAWHIQKGDFLVLLSAFFWALHVHIIAHFSPKIRSGQLAFIQYAVCALASLITAVLFESFSMELITKAAIPILYGGIMSVGVAYSLQIVAQKHTPPSHAAIILSLEAVFAVFGGWLLLQEMISLRGFVGCVLMLAGMLVSQLAVRRED